MIFKIDSAYLVILVIILPQLLYPVHYLKIHVII